MTNTMIVGIKLDVVCHQDEDGMWIAECPQLVGCVSQGKTVHVASHNLLDAARGCIEAIIAHRQQPVDINPSETVVWQS